MDFLFNIYVGLLLSSRLNSEVVSYQIKDEKHNKELSSIANNPERWTLKINKVDIYTFLISSHHVPFCVELLNKEEIVIYLDLGNLDSYCDKKTFYYITIHSLVKPTKKHHSEVFQIEQTWNKKMIVSIEPHVVIFLCYMVYMYRGIVEISYFDFPKSRFKRILKHFTYSSFNLQMKFTSEYPLKSYHTDLGLVDYIRDCLIYYKRNPTSISRDYNIVDLLNSFFVNNEISLEIMSTGLFKEMILDLNTDLKLYIINDRPISLKIYEIFGRCQEMFQDCTNCCHQ